MKNLFLFFALVFVACTGDVPRTTGKSPLTLHDEENVAWRYENLRLYPVSLVETQDVSSLQTVKLLSEAMKTPGFRIVEQKQFGRSQDNWFHGVTVQNKTQDTILLLSGDVVKGGNQDRVIAHHEVIMPRSVRNIEVFCVEAGRSTYYNPQASVAEKEIAAFSGYFSVASPKVRRAVQSSGNQSEVWAAVASVTKANSAESATSAYTALDQESAQKQRRDAYLDHLGRAFEQNADVTGVIAVCGDRVLGVDVFADADLFHRAYPALLHGYVAEAAMHTPEATITATSLQETFSMLQKCAESQTTEQNTIGKFIWRGSWVHLYGK